MTRECLKVLARYDVPITIVSGVRSRLILRDLDLLKDIKNLSVITELCRLDQIEVLCSGKESVNISVANELIKEGIPVFATLSPILPGITDLDDVLQRLDPRISVYVDSLDIKKDSIRYERFFAYLWKSRPELVTSYEVYVEEDRDNCLKEIVEKYADNSRVKVFPIY